MKPYVCAICILGIESAVNMRILPSFMGAVKEVQEKGSLLLDASTYYSARTAVTFVNGTALCGPHGLRMIQREYNKPR